MFAFQLNFMTTEKTAAAIADFKEKTLNKNKTFLQQEGALPSTVTIFMLRPNQTYHYVAFSLEELGAHKGLDFVKKISLPILIKSLRITNHKILCVSLTTEAFMAKIKLREMFETLRDSPNEKEFNQKINAIEKQEVLMTVFETAESQETPVFNMIRIGKTINSRGRLVDRIELEPSDLPPDASMKGLFGYLFKDEK